MLVEDNEKLRRALRVGLEVTDQVRVVGGVASGEEAVAHCQNSPPEAVLMDVALAGEMNGIQAAIALRREHPRLPVVFYFCPPSVRSTHGPLFVPFRKSPANRASHLFGQPQRSGTDGVVETNTPCATRCPTPEAACKVPNTTCGSTTARESTWRNSVWPDLFSPGLPGTKNLSRAR